ncbi:unnamed protein product [Sphagnum balticum]
MHGHIWSIQPDMQCNCGAGQRRHGVSSRLLAIGGRQCDHFELYVKCVDVVVGVVSVLGDVQLRLSIALFGLF